MAKGAGENLIEIQQLARELHEKLKHEFGKELFQMSGNLLLGNCYGKSNRIFLGLNPGGSENDSELCVALEGKNFWDSDSLWPYWKNCKTFVNGANGLHEWMTPATAAFCCPWRTRNKGDLDALNERTGGKLFEYCKCLMGMLVEHHRAHSSSPALTVVAAGRESLYLMARFMGFEWSKRQTYHVGSHTYQWAKVEHNDLLIYQVPHFSRANSCKRLTDCAEWLASDLGL
ncbi:MAG TPA: hypothetical protein VG206_24100 [Terriglobia bacterium]|nr:hypothetical protein [Terriglobia bacterium]